MEVNLIGYSIPVCEKTDAGVEYIAEMAAAKCHNGKPTLSALNHALSSAHDSVVEHILFTFEVNSISRACLGQVVRHRMASFSVMSQRYVNQTEVPAIMPPSIQQNETAKDIFDMIEAASTEAYEELLRNGIPKEDARFALLEAKSTSMVISMNCRELMHFFSLRCCNRAQWEIREVAWRMLRICKDICPNVFKDAGPGCMRGRCPEEKPCGKPYPSSGGSRDEH